jgi:hypothetical protein
MLIYGSTDLIEMETTVFIATVFCKKKWLNLDFNNKNVIHLLLGLTVTLNFISVTKNCIYRVA